MIHYTGLYRGPDDIRERFFCGVDPAGGKDQSGVGALQRIGETFVVTNMAAKEFRNTISEAARIVQRLMRQPRPARPFNRKRYLKMKRRVRNRVARGLTEHFKPRRSSSLFVSYGPKRRVLDKLFHNEI